jgi:hypothetical protein
MRRWLAKPAGDIAGLSFMPEVAWATLGAIRRRRGASDDDHRAWIEHIDERPDAANPESA